jgi:hypothetical protein
VRKILLIGAIATALAATGLVGTAGAQTASRFTVLAIDQSRHHQRSGALVIRGRLAVPGDRDDTIGHFKAKFTLAHHKLRVRAVFYFANGKIKAKGTLSHNNRVQIIGGTRAWNGASGKILTHGSRLLFVVVQ